MRPALLQNIEVRQVRFHPGSPHDNHLVILMSDNTLRVYKVPVASSNDEFMEDPELVHVWTLGQHSMDGTGAVWNLRGNKVPFLVGLGELAVDFDFGLAVMASTDFFTIFGTELRFAPHTHPT